MKEAKKLSLFHRWRKCEIVHHCFGGDLGKYPILSLELNSTHSSSLPQEIQQFHHSFGFNQCTHAYGTTLSSKMRTSRNAVLAISSLRLHKNQTNKRAQLRMIFLKKNSQRTLNTFAYSHKASVGVGRLSLCVSGAAGLAFWRSMGMVGVEPLYFFRWPLNPHSRICLGFSESINNTTTNQWSNLGTL